MQEINDVARERSISREDIADLLESGGYLEGDKAILSLLSATSDDAELLNSLGSIYARRGDYSNAESFFNKAITIDPSSGGAYYNLGLVHSKQCRGAAAIEDFLKAIEINPADYAAHNDLGVQFHSQGEYRLAREHFIKALEANVRYRKALMNLFAVCFDADSYSEGLAWMENYIKASFGGDEESADYWD